MRGHDQVLELLNDVLTGELTAINQYFIHAEMCENWGFHRLYAHIRKESIEEMQHAEKCIERILYLDGVPNMQRYFKLNVGQTVSEQFRSDLELEKQAIERLAKGIELCRSLGDHGTRDLLEKMLVDEEGHADWLETQLSLIEQLGEQHYLAQQIHAGDDEK